MRAIANRNDPALCLCGRFATREIRTPSLANPDIRPYVAVAGDRAGRLIGSRREHLEYLKRNRLHVADDQKVPEGPRPQRPIPRTREYVIERREDLRRALRRHVPLETLRKVR